MNAQKHPPFKLLKIFFRPIIRPLSGYRLDGKWMENSHLNYE